MPEVSVILPAYHAEQTIHAAVRSILGQTFSDLELIVVDDGSTDRTVDVLRGIDDRRLNLVTSPHQGVVAASNRAMEMARGSLIARMDADDVAHPQRLAKQRDYILAHQLDAVGCQVRIVDRLGQPCESMRRYERWINEETLTGESIAAFRFVELPLVNPTILARRRYFELGFRDTDQPEDYDLMLRAAADGMRFGKVPEVLFDWIDHPGRSTRTDARYSEDAFAKCRRKHLSAGPLREVAQVDLWGVGQTGKPWLRWLQSQGVTVRQGYEVNIRKVGLKIHGVPIVHADTLVPADGTPLIIAVGAESARRVILPQLASQGYVAGRDAWFVA